MANLVFMVDTLNRGGGTERYIAEMSGLLSKEHNVSVLSLDGDLGSYFPISSKVQRLSTKKKYKRHRLAKWPERLFSVPDIQSYLDQTPELRYVLPVGLRLNHFALKCLNKKNQKVIVCEHLSYEDARRHRVGKKILRLIKSDTPVIAQTQKARSQYLSFSNQVYHVSNFVNLPQKFNLERSLRGVVHFVSIGAIQKHKGYHRVIPFLTCLKKAGVSFRYSIYGASLNSPKESLYQSKFIQDLKSSGLYESVSFIGFEKSLEKIYNDKNILLVTSLSESCPYTILEAKSFGLPVLSYDFIGAPEEFIRNDEDGYVEKESSDLFEKFKLLFEDHLKYQAFQKASYSHMGSTFSETNIFSQWQTMLGELKGLNSF